MYFGRGDIRALPLFVAALYILYPILMVPGLAIIVVLVLLLLGGGYAYMECKLNKHLPAKLRRKCKKSGGFVGAYGRTPAMESCHPHGGDQKHHTSFNRCIYA